MTVALNDVVILSQMLGRVRNLGDWGEVGGVLHSWHWGRKPLSSTINILSVALYDLFGAEGEFFACWYTTDRLLTCNQMRIWRC